MGILDQYKAALEVEKEKESMDFPSDTNLTEKDKEAYEETLNKMRKGNFSNEEIKEAINNSRKNMAALNEVHNGGINERAMEKPTKISDEELVSKGLLKENSISDIKVIRAYCPNCGKELVAKAPPMYNPFTMEKMCLHECCGVKYNLDKTYPHIAFYDEDGKEIVTFM